MILLTTFSRDVFRFVTFWPVLYSLRSFTATFVAPQCSRLIIRKIETSLVKSGKEMMRNRAAVQPWRVSPSRWTRASPVVLSSNFIKTALTNHFIRLQTTSSTYLRVCFSYNTATAIRKPPGFGLWTQHFLQDKICMLRKPTRRDSLKRDNNFTCSASSV